MQTAQKLEKESDNFAFGRIQTFEGSGNRIK